MRIFDTVKTEKKAKEIINEYLQEHNIKDGLFKNSSIQCECGETECITYTTPYIILYVGICNSCGDNDAIVNEVLNIN